MTTKSTPHRRTQLMQLAQDARESGNHDLFEEVRSDIFKEFNLDIGGMAEGGVTLQFDEGEVAETMFRGGVGFKGHF